VFELENENVIDDLKLTITDVQGKIIMEDEYKNCTTYFSNTIDVSEFSSGIYLVSIKSEKYSSIKKLIVNKQ
jgi:hypothetical protein